MTSTRNNGTSRALIVFSALLMFIVLLGLWIRHAYAQTSCTGNPPPIGPYHWSQGTTVYYSLDASLDSTSPGGQQDQINQGLAAWNTANAANGSSITFAPADQSHSATLTFQANTQQSNVPAGWGLSPRRMRREILLPP